MTTTFFQIHHFCAAHWVADAKVEDAEARKKMKEESDSRAAIPIVGLALGTVGLVAAVAGVIIGGLAVLVFFAPACCGNEFAKYFLDKAVEVFVTGLFMTLVYPALMVYGQTLGWVTHTCCFKSGKEQDFHPVE